MSLQAKLHETVNQRTCFHHKAALFRLWGVLMLPSVAWAGQTSLNAIRSGHLFIKAVALFNQLVQLNDPANCNQTRLPCRHQSLWIFSTSAWWTHLLSIMPLSRHWLSIKGKADAPFDHLSYTVFVNSENTFSLQKIDAC